MINDVRNKCIIIKCISKTERYVYAFTSKHGWCKIFPDFLFDFGACPPATGAALFFIYFIFWRWDTMSQMSDFQFCNNARSFKFVPERGWKSSAWFSSTSNFDVNKVPCLAGFFLLWISNMYLRLRNSSHTIEDQ